MEHYNDLSGVKKVSSIIKDKWTALGGFYVCLYLGSIIAANLLTAAIGPSITIVNAFLFIGLDLTSRDHLHDKWQHKGLVWKMGILILFGSLLSWALNHNAGLIALASFIAFALSAVIDTIVYQLLHNQEKVVKINGSNIISAAIDSVTFPTIAFGGFLPLIMLGQFAAKVGGGFVWSIVLRRFR